MGVRSSPDMTGGYANLGGGIIRRAPGTAVQISYIMSEIVPKSNRVVNTFLSCCFLVFILWTLFYL